MTRGSILPGLIYIVSSTIKYDLTVYRKKAMRIAFLVLAFLWEMPQTLLGLAVLYHNRKRVDAIFQYRSRFLFLVPEFVGGISLGMLSFGSRVKILQHEYGHTRQSKILGPLYLVFIGLPSILWASTRFITRRWVNYDWFFIEAMATKLGKHLDLRFVNAYYRKERRRLK